MEFANNKDEDDDTVMVTKVVKTSEMDDKDNDSVKTSENTKHKDKEIPSADFDTTHPTNNKDCTKGSHNPCIRKQLQLPMDKIKEAPTMKQLKLTKEMERDDRIIYLLKLQCPKSKDPIKTMKDKLREWFKEMNKCSPSFVVYKWKDMTFSKAITCSNCITANIYEMKHYFYRIFPVVDESDIWCTIHAGHNKEAEDIKENTAWWYKLKKTYNSTRQPLSIGYYGHTNT